MSASDFAPIMSNDDDIVVSEMAEPSFATTSTNNNSNFHSNAAADFEPLHASDAARRLVTNEITVEEENDDDVPAFAAPAMAPAPSAGEGTLLERIRKAQQQQQQQQQPPPQQPSFSPLNQMSTDYAQQGLEMEQSTESLTPAPPMEPVNNNNTMGNTNQPQQQQPAQQQQVFLQPDSYSYATPGTNPMMPPMYSPVSGGNHAAGGYTAPLSSTVMDVLSSVGSAAGKAASFTMKGGKKMVNKVTNGSNEHQTQSLLNENNDVENNNGNQIRSQPGNPIEDVVSATNTMQPPSSSDTSVYNMNEYFRQFLTDVSGLFMASPWFVKVAVVFLVWLFFWLLLS